MNSYPRPSLPKQDAFPPSDSNQFISDGVVAPNFRLSKLVKFLTGSTLLCSTVLSFALLTPNTAYTKTINLTKSSTKAATLNLSAVTKSSAVKPLADDDDDDDNDEAPPPPGDDDDNDEAPPPPGDDDDDDDNDVAPPPPGEDDDNDEAPPPPGDDDPDDEAPPPPGDDDPDDDDGGDNNGKEDPDPEEEPTPSEENPPSETPPEVTQPDTSAQPSDKGKTLATLAGIGGNLAMHYAQLDNLRNRLGEVRYGAQDGLWARAIYQRDRWDGAAANGGKQKWYSLNVGFDRLVAQDEERMWLLGANFKYGHADRRAQERLAKGKGDLNTYGFNLYATYANQYGCYTDLVLTLDQYHQKLGISESGSSSNGKYNTWGWGASVEVGKMFSFTPNDENWGPWHNHWWIEPQAQLSYYWLKGKDWTMSDGMYADQKNGNSLVGRLGLVIGKHWSYGGDTKADKRYVQAYLKGGVKYEFLGKQDMKVDDYWYRDHLRGATGYYGLGVDWNLTKQLRAYGQVERESGGKYKKDIEASVGLKWQF